MTLRSEVEALRRGPRTILLVAASFALAFTVGIAVRELFDSRTAGAVAWILVFVALSIPSVIRAHPERTTAVLTSVGAGAVLSAVIAAATGALAVALVFFTLGAIALLYARRLQARLT
jgi:hypothetical protein